jgi:hypothetical protein
MDEDFGLGFGVRLGVDLSFISVFIYLHIIQKRIRKFMSHRNICVCLYVIHKRIRKFMSHRNICFYLYVFHSTSPCSRYISHSELKWPNSSIQAVALIVFPNSLLNFQVHISPLQQTTDSETGAPFLFIHHFVNHCSVSDR